MYWDFSTILFIWRQEAMDSAPQREIILRGSLEWFLASSCGCLLVDVNSGDLRLLPLLHSREQVWGQESGVRCRHQISEDFLFFCFGSACDSTFLLWRHWSRSAAMLHTRCCRPFLLSIFINILIWVDSAHFGGPFSGGYCVYYRMPFHFFSELSKSAWLFSWRAKVQLEHHGHLGTLKFEAQLGGQIPQY